MQLASTTSPGNLKACSSMGGYKKYDIYKNSIHQNKISINESKIKTGDSQTVQSLCKNMVLKDWIISLFYSTPALIAILCK